MQIFLKLTDTLGHWLLHLPIGTSQKLLLSCPPSAYNSKISLNQLLLLSA